ncbi:MAG: homogentisate 1,2-dioxygenase [Sphingobium sp. 66-54]|nr:MAG: homogentisate 1,2-dioxygenase [Sphingobium sp. 66-54]
MALLLLSLALAAAAPAGTAATAAPACPATPAPLPAALAPWTEPASLTAAMNAAGLEAATLPLGAAKDLALSRTPQVRYAVRPERPGGSVSHGGMARFVVVQAGVYRVAMDSAAWIDVVADGKSLESVKHGHGPDCSGIRKMVDFQLAPGAYVLQVVGNGTPGVRVLVTSVPAA